MGKAQLEKTINVYIWTSTSTFLVSDAFKDENAHNNMLELF